MARIFTQRPDSNSDAWYEQIEPSTMLEAEFERKVLLHANTVYPNYFVIPFKKLVPVKNPNTGEFEKVKPDLAFVSKDYREWWVVEIEMGYHSLNSHVIPQVEKLKNADYTIDIAEYLAQASNLCATAIQKLIYNNDTQVLVIMNQLRHEWILPLTKLGAFVAVFETYMGDGGREMFRANGAYPLTTSDVLSPCRYHPVISSLLGIEEPENLDLPNNQGILRLRFNNCLTEWKRVDADGKVWLQPISRSPLNRSKTYQILRQIDGQLVLSECI